MATKPTGATKNSPAADRKSSTTKSAPEKLGKKPTKASRGSMAIKAIIDSPATRQVMSKALTAAAGAAAGVIFKEVRGGQRKLTGKTGGVVKTLKEAAGSAAAATVDVVADAAKASVAPTLDATIAPRKLTQRARKDTGGRTRPAKPK